jgi:hypothetical protein
MVVPLTRHYPDLVVCVPDRSTWKIVVRMEIGPLLNAGMGATLDKAVLVTTKSEVCGNDR